MLVANYKTKKSLKEHIGFPLQFTETSVFGDEYIATGKFTVVGPAAYIRKWHAEVTMKDDVIVKVT